MKNKTLILSTICLLFLTLDGFGQITTVKEAEYNELDAIQEKIWKLSRTETTITNEYKDKVIVKSEKIVKEYESEDRFKITYYVTNDVKKITRETIYYDDREFRRENEGEWKEIDRSGPRVPTNFMVEELPKMVQWGIGKSTFNNKPVRLFSFYRVYNIHTYLTFYDSVTRVGEDEKIINFKSVESIVFPNNITEIVETNYQYHSPKLKIEIPKNAKVVKQ